MRGHDTQEAGLFSYLSPEERAQATHPLRPIRHAVDTALVAPAGDALCPNRSALDYPGKAPARAVAAGALQPPE